MAASAPNSLRLTLGNGGSSVTVRTYKDEVREKTLKAIDRIVRLKQSGLNVRAINLSLGGFDKLEKYRTTFGDEWGAKNPFQT